MPFIFIYKIFIHISTKIIKIFWQNYSEKIIFEASSSPRLGVEKN